MYVGGIFRVRVLRCSFYTIGYRRSRSMIWNGVAIMKD